MLTASRAANGSIQLGGGGWRFCYGCTGYMMIEGATQYVAGRSIILYLQVMHGSSMRTVLLSV
jgi:hypothetical protein